MSSDGHFLAAVTDNNLVCIWRYAPPTAAAVANPVPTIPSTTAQTQKLAATAAGGATVMPVDEAGNPIEPIIINLPVVDALPM